MTNENTHPAGQGRLDVVVRRLVNEGTKGRADMNKWLERGAIAAVLLILAVAAIGMYATWRYCKATGGTTVRGLFGLECIKQ